MDEYRSWTKVNWTKTGLDECRIGQKALDQNRLDENRLDENWAHGLSHMVYVGIDLHTSQNKTIKNDALGNLSLIQDQLSTILIDQNFRD